MLDGWTVCVEHRGQHGMRGGACVRVGREVPRPFSFRAGVCLDCGADLDLKTDNRSGRVERLVAGTDERHWHAPAVSVALDESRLAGAIVEASRAARQERRQEVQQRRSPATTAPTAPDPQQPAHVGPHRVRLD